MRKRKLFFYINFTLLTLSQIYFAQESIWTKLSNIPTSRWHLSSAVIGDNIYAIGGVNGYWAIEEYNTVNDSWTIKNQLSDVRAFLGCGAVNGKVYIIGGAVLNQPAKSSVEEYDPISDSLVAMQDMPSARQGMGSCVLDDKIYLVGGMEGNGTPNDKVDAYDPITDQWITGLSPIPTSRWEPECVVLDKNIYAIGGFTDIGSCTATNAVEMYDPTTNQWKKRASLPDKRGGGEAVALNGIIYYFGGSRDFGDPLGNVWAYISSSNKWIELANMPFNWFLMTGSVVGNKIYLMGGSKIAWPHNDDFKEVYLFTPPDSLLLGVNEKIQYDNIPSKFILNQNYPNPFNPNTRIQYTLPKDNKRETKSVKLVVFDNLGREVVTLVNDKQKPGNYEIEFDPSSLPANGRRISSGMYFYSLHAGDYAETKKMVLLK